MVDKAKINKKFKHDQSQHSSKVTDTYASELPGDVIYRILCLLSTKNAVRASFLSKEWRRVWSMSTFPVLDFDEDEIDQGSSSENDHRRGKKRRNFMSFVRRNLEQRENDKSDIEKFRLRMCYYYGAVSMLKWLTFAVDRNVKELDICCIQQIGASRCFYLPPSILNDAKCLTVLKLENVTVNKIPDTISFPSLKSLSLIEVEFIGPSTFMKLFPGCPAVEHLFLISCRCPSFYEPFNLKKSSLKSLEFECCECGPNVRVEATNLETLKFRGYREFFDIFSCHNIRSMELSGTNVSRNLLTDQWFEKFHSSFPHLESLILNRFSSYRNYEETRNNILSRRPSLQHFELVFQGQLQNPGN